MGNRASGPFCHHYIVFADARRSKPLGQPELGGSNTSNSSSNNSGWDWHDVTFQFRIIAPHSPSTLLASAVSALTGLPSTTLPALFNTWGSNTTAPSDYPNVQFQLDLLMTVATMHLPFLTGAKLDTNGLLEADRQTRMSRSSFRRFSLR